MLLSFRGYPTWGYLPHDIRIRVATDLNEKFTGSHDDTIHSILRSKHSRQMKMNQCLKKIRYQSDLRKRDAGRDYHSALWVSLLALTLHRLAVV